MDSHSVEDLGLPFQEFSDHSVYTLVNILLVYKLSTEITQTSVSSRNGIFLISGSCQSDNWINFVGRGTTMITNKKNLGILDYEILILLIDTI